VPGARGLLERLVASVRPEFRADELAFDPRHPVFGGHLCLVPGCGRTARNQGMCLGHRQRWDVAGRPEKHDFATSTDPGWRKDTPLSRCIVPECGYGGAAGQGLCGRHVHLWVRAGKPGLQGWLGKLPGTAPTVPPADCLIGTCQVWAEPRHELCLSHLGTWKKHGRPSLAEFVRDWTTRDPVPRYERIQLGPLPAQLKLEMQYALQRRHDERAGKAAPLMVNNVVRVLAASGASSLLDRTEQEWRKPFGKGRPNAASLIVWSRRQIVDLAEGSGWDAEYGRDTWHMHRLGFTVRHTISFAGIPQPWLKDLAKRWIRWRLSTGLGLASGGERPVHTLAHFGSFLAARDITGPAEVDRTVIEAYLAHLQAEMGGTRQQREHVSMLGRFLAAVRQHDWDTGLPASAMIFRGEQPRKPELLPRALPGNVMAQVEQPANLQRWDNPAYLVATVILIRCGLRVSDALKLPFDCTVADADGAPYLRYYNHKMKREALVPIDEEVLALIAEQQGRVLERWPAEPQFLFPRPTKNPDGKAPVSSSTYRVALDKWLEYCDIRDEHGRPVHLTPHQWRHTLGTVLINRDVPQHVVQKILDHDSPLMTAHYARLSDKTVRDHWEKARKVNIAGQPVQVSPDGPLGDAAWAKHSLSRATQSLPNGYCELPLVKTCPHANSCLTCPMFITTPEFLPQHRAQRTATLQIITAAEAAGHARVTEMNKQVAANLDKIIAALETDSRDQEASAGAP
jgi:integrase